MEQHQFEDGMAEKICASMPCDVGFELFVIGHCLAILESLVQKFPTSLESDKKLLRALNGEDMGTEIAAQVKSKKDHWRYKLAIMHRVNIKEIFARQKNFLLIVQTTL